VARARSRAEAAAMMHAPCSTLTGAKGVGMALEHAGGQWRPKAHAAGSWNASR
jgi:hypothetical protein